MLTNALRALAYSNIWIAAGASTFTLLFYWAFELQIDYLILGFTFTATLFTYTFQRIIKLRSNERISGPRMDWMRKHKTWVILVLGISFLATICLSLFLSWKTIMALIIMGAISVLYAVKLNLGFGIKTNLRDISGIKIILIAIVWSSSCSIMPAIAAGYWNNYILLFSIGVALYIIGITIPFDIRDLEVDEPQKKTIPQLLGVKKAKILGVLCVGMGNFLMCFVSNLNLFFLIPGLLFSSFLILFSDKKTPELYFSFLLDGMLILVPTTYYLLKIL